MTPEEKLGTDIMFSASVMEVENILRKLKYAQDKNDYGVLGEIASDLREAAKGVAELDNRANGN